MTNKCYSKIVRNGSLLWLQTDKINTWFYLWLSKIIFQQGDILPDALTIVAFGPLGVAEVGAFEAEVAVDAGDGEIGDSSTVIGDFKSKLQPLFNQF